MDVQIRYWNEIAKQINMWFFDFQFSRCPNAKNLFDWLIILLTDFPSECLLQLSMDGPNTNWSILTMLHSDRCEKDYPRIIDIGSGVELFLFLWYCWLTEGVYALFPARMIVEATDWFLNKILKAMWKIFDDSLARWDTYINICEVDEFPLRYWFYIVYKPYPEG